MTREQVIERVLGHIQNGWIEWFAQAAPTDRDAADRIRHVMGISGYYGPAGTWRAGPKGVTYAPPGDPNAMPRPEDGYPLITWLEIARAARGSGEQLVLGVGR